MDGRVIASGGRRSARRRLPSVAWATVKVFDATGGPPGATLNSPLIKWLFPALTPR